MIPPSEYVARHITPLIRELALHHLLAKGYSQNKLARLTGLSQPLLWKISRKDPHAITQRLTQQGVPPEDVEAMKELLAKTLISQSPREAARRLILFEHSLLARGVICEAYAEATGMGREACSLMEHYPPPRDALLKELQEWFHSLSRIPRIHLHLPQVGSNLVLAEEDAASHMQTVAFPGRIVSIGSRLRAIGDPAYGASLHTARVLLAVRRGDRGKRAAFVLRHDPEVVRRLGGEGLVVCRVEAYRGEPELLGSVGAQAARRGGCDVVEALPVPGVEPVIYLVSSELGELVSMVRVALGV